MCSYLTNIKVTLVHLKSASSSLLCRWFWLAFLQCSEYIRELFRGDTQYNFPAIAERIYFVREPCFLDCVQYADRASVEFAPLPVSHLVCMFWFFLSLPFAGVITVIPIFNVTKFKVWRTLPLARPL